MELPESIAAFVRNRLIFKQGQSIFEEGSEIPFIFIILQGKVRIRKHTPKGLVTLAVLEKGHVLGETSFFDKASPSPVPYPKPKPKRKAKPLK